MSTGTSFIDIKVRQGPLFRKVETPKRLFLPLSWQANQRRWQIFRMPLFLSMFILFGFGLIYNGWIFTGFAIVSYFGFITYMIFRSKLSLQKIGSSRVTIYGEGFNDERLGTDRILWHDMRILTIRHSRRGPPVGISLLSNHELSMKGATIDYVSFKRAYFLVGTGAKRALYIDFAGVEKAAEIEKAICALIKAAKPQ